MGTLVTVFATAIGTLVVAIWFPEAVDHKPVMIIFSTAKISIFAFSLAEL